MFRCAAASATSACSCSVLAGLIFAQLIKRNPPKFVIKHPFDEVLVCMEVEFFFSVNYFYSCINIVFFDQKLVQCTVGKLMFFHIYYS